MSAIFFRVSTRYLRDFSMCIVGSFLVGMLTHALTEIVSFVSHFSKLILISTNGITIAVLSSGLQHSAVRREPDILQKRVVSIVSVEECGKPSRLSWYGIAHIARARARGFLCCLFPGITSTQFMSPTCHFPICIPVRSLPASGCCSEVQY
jgi:hypothetical protein